MRTDELDFHLPPELIAQVPPAERTASRLMHYRRSDKLLSHGVFSDLPNLLRAGDLLVFNDARVLPARFALRKSTGGRIDALFLDEPSPGTWHVLLRNMGSARTGEFSLIGAEEITARVVEAAPMGEFTLEMSSRESANKLLNRIGRMPLPPYIHRGRASDERDETDRRRYQTVFAKTPGAVAAPTAALHFSQLLLDQLAEMGVERTFVTLHVGMGTFKPVTADTLEAHAMHSERYEITAEAAAALNRAKAGKRRIISVGTTSARVLESQGAETGGNKEYFRATRGETGILIFPPYQWKHVSALLTNFHLPRSTLIALVAAFVGLDVQRSLYQAAIDQRYRFFSFGDAMFLE
jgi:S-adenosylmethionine:tRNA ribosyltransferase-isomerase